MSHATLDTPTRLTDRARWVRAAAFGCTSAAIGVLGHAYAMHAAPSWWLLAACALLMTLLARPLTHLRVSGTALLLALAAAQGLVHVVCSVMPHRDAAAATMPGMSASHHMHMTHAAAQHTTPDWPLMLLVHVVALVVGASILTRLDVALWARAVTVVRGAARAIVAFVLHVGAHRRAQLASHTQRARATRFDAHAGCHSSQWFVACTGRRGPPQLAV